MTTIYNKPQTASNHDDRERLLQDYGTKHTNLILQSRLIDQTGLQDVEVPMPQGLSSEKIVQFLKEKAPCVFNYWEQLGNAYEQAPHKQGFLREKEQQDLLEKIKGEIAEAFREGAEDLIPTQWLTSIEGHLMVRSTGAEDSSNAANAGGNVSVAYVEPNSESFGDAVGKVVTSYFSYDSLNNRIAADPEQNPFREELKLAVTAQPLIGEIAGGSDDPTEVPISLVLVTNEPLYVGEEKFRVMRISATWGHGEGVVENLGIATDTILVTQSVADPTKIEVLYDRQKKPERLAPVWNARKNKVVLERVRNTPEMAKATLLDEEMIHRLFDLGLAEEQFFDSHPTDMEVVIKGSKIYPVQARPVNRPKSYPTYLDLKKAANCNTSPILEKLEGEMIVPGKSSLVSLTEKNDILVADTLKEAERIFDPKKHKLVIVGKKEPANSHPVVNFSGLGMPCLYAADLAAVKALVDQIDETRPIAACIQSGTLFLWNRSVSSIEGCTSEGYVVHPAKIAISYPAQEEQLPTKEGHRALMPKKVKNLLFKIRTATTTQIAQQNLEKLESQDWLQKLDSEVKPLEKHGIAKPLIQATHQVNEKVKNAFSQVRATLEKKSLGLEFLFHLKTLETSLFQQPSEGTLDGYSLHSLENNLEATKELIAYEQQLQSPAEFADLLLDAHECPSEKIVGKWQNFLLRLESLHQKAKEHNSTSALEDLNTFKKNILFLRTRNNLPFFFTFLFHLDQKDSLQNVQALNTLIAADEDSTREEIDSFRERVEIFSRQLDRFSNPKAHGKAFTELQELVNSFKTENRKWLQTKNWNQLSLLTRNSALQAMEELVELYDSAIKTMKVSSQFASRSDQAKLLKEMLLPFLSLFEDWSHNVISQELYAELSCYDPKHCIDYITEALQAIESPDETQMQPSADFNVSTSSIGTKANYRVNKPKTLEDNFTLIHQNLEAVLAKLNKDLITDDLMKEGELPKPFLSFDRNMKNLQKLYKEELGVNPLNSQCIGIKVTKERIEFQYNIPLNNHSSKLIFSYERKVKKFHTHVQFMGNNDRDRWTKLEDWVSFLDHMGILSISSPIEQNDKGLSFYWDLSTGENKKIKTSIEEFHNLAFYTFGTEPKFLLDNVFHSLKNNTEMIDKAIAYFLENIDQSSFCKDIAAIFWQQILENKIEINFDKLKNSFPLFEKTYKKNDQFLLSFLELLRKKNWIGPYATHFLQSQDKEARSTNVNYLKQIIEEGNSDEIEKVAQVLSTLTEPFAEPTRIGGLWKMLIETKHKPAIEAAKEFTNKLAASGLKTYLQKVLDTHDKTES